MAKKLNSKFILIFKFLLVILLFCCFISCETEAHSAKTSASESSSSPSCSSRRVPGYRGSHGFYIQHDNNGKVQPQNKTARGDEQKTHSNHHLFHRSVSSVTNSNSSSSIHNGTIAHPKNVRPLLKDVRENTENYGQQSPSTTFSPDVFSTTPLTLSVGTTSSASSTVTPSTTTTTIVSIRHHKKHRKPKNHQKHLKIHQKKLKTSSSEQVNYERVSASFEDKGKWKTKTPTTTGSPLLKIKTAFLDGIIDRKRRGSAFEGGKDDEVPANEKIVISRPASSFGSIDSKSSTADEKQTTKTEVTTEEETVEELFPPSSFSETTTTMLPFVESYRIEEGEQDEKSAINGRNDENEAADDELGGQTVDKLAGL